MVTPNISDYIILLEDTVKDLEQKLEKCKEVLRKEAPTSKEARTLLKELEE